MNGKKIVIIGGGFGGLSAANKLKNSEYEITIIDKTNHHLFQPLLYQVATAALSPADIAIPIRAIFRGYKNIKIIMDTVQAVDKINRKVILSDRTIEFDYLIIAPGAKHSYFGKNEWEKYAPGIKDLGDSLKIREKILFSLEEAEKINQPEERKKYITFVIVGGGPTGVELSGAIAEIAKKTMLSDFQNIHPSETKVYLLEVLPKILSSYPDELSNTAKEYLENLGVEIKLNALVTEVNDSGVWIGEEFIETKNVIWAAGNAASPLIKTLEIETDRAGRAFVNKDCTIKDLPFIFVIGDAAAFKDKNGKILPGIAPVAMQQGKYAADIILENKNPEKRKEFRYRDKGNMATVGRAKAVAEISGFKLTGLFAWLAWSFVHIFYLIGFRNRIRVMAEWIWYYITFRHGIRLIINKNKDVL